MGCSWQQATSYSSGNGGKNWSNSSCRWRKWWFCRVALQKNQILSNKMLDWTSWNWDSTWFGHQVGVMFFLKIFRLPFWFIGRPDSCRCWSSPNASTDIVGGSSSWQLSLLTKPKDAESLSFSPKVQALVSCGAHGSKPKTLRLLRIQVCGHSSSSRAGRIFTTRLGEHSNGMQKSWPCSPTFFVDYWHATYFVPESSIPLILACMSLNRCTRPIYYVALPSCPISNMFQGNKRTSRIPIWPGTAKIRHFWVSSIFCAARDDSISSQVRFLRRPRLLFLRPALDDLDTHHGGRGWVAVSAWFARQVARSGRISNDAIVGLVGRGMAWQRTCHGERNWFERGGTLW